MLCYIRKGIIVCCNKMCSEHWKTLVYFFFKKWMLIVFLAPFCKVFCCSFLMLDRWSSHFLSTQTIFPEELIWCWWSQSSPVSIYNIGSLSPLVVGFGFQSDKFFMVPIPFISRRIRNPPNSVIVRPIITSFPAFRSYVFAISRLTEIFGFRFRLTDPTTEGSGFSVPLKPKTKPKFYPKNR